MARRFKLNREEAIYGWLFVFPHVLGLLVFTIGAIFASGYLSLTRWDLFGAPQWVGLDNYCRLADYSVYDVAVFSRKHIAETVIAVDNRGPHLLWHFVLEAFKNAVHGG